MQRKYGWYAENRPRIVVNPDEVPQHLRDLIPYAERWAISCDITRHDYFHKVPKEDIWQFAVEVCSRSDEINAWLNSLPPMSVQPWPEAALHFLCLQTALFDAICWFGPEGMKKLGLA
jgi:hypothetical protein